MITKLSTNEKTIMKANHVHIGDLKDLFYLPLLIENKWFNNFYFRLGTKYLKKNP